MPEGITRPTNVFGFVDLSTTDPVAAKAFYTRVFGWTTIDMPVPGGTYTMCGVPNPEGTGIRGAYVCGIGTLQPEQRAQGIPPSWTACLWVDDLDFVTEKAGKLGATILAQPFEVMDQGRMSLIQDPVGAVFALWQQTGPHAGELITNEPGFLSWTELSTTDARTAQEFYTELLGWTPQEVPYGDGAPYIMLNNGETPAAGIWPKSDEQQILPPHWLNYFAVASCDATVQTATEAGANVLVPPTDSSYGKFSVLTDPQGAAFAVVQLPPPTTA